MSNQSNFRVDLEFPKVKVCFQHLKVDAMVHVGSRALPTIPNFIFNMTEVNLRDLMCLLNYDFLVLSLTMFHETDLLETVEDFSKSEKEIIYRKQHKWFYTAFKVSFVLL